MSTTKQLHVYLFGSFRLVRNGVEVSSKDWYTRQARQLFKVLLQERGHLVSANKLIDLLWPENVENAHKALRSAVSALRDVLEPEREPWLSSSFVPRGQNGYALVFPPDCRVWVDVAEFERLLDLALQSVNTAESRTMLACALQFYAGEYLAEDGEAAWVLAERTRLRERYFAGVIHLMQWWGELACYREAIELGRRALEQDTCREPLYRLIMQYQALAGDKAGALLTFEQCRRELDRHLGADPSAQTLALHIAILNGTFPEQRYAEAAALAWPALDDDHEAGASELEQRLVEAQERALHYTLQAADYARRVSSYRQALVDYDAASRLLQAQCTWQNNAVKEASAEWWSRLYYGRGLVYEALMDWQGIQENHHELSAWAVQKQDPVLASGSTQRMIVNRSLMGYLSEALGMEREFIRQLQKESEKFATQNSPTGESLRLLTDLARRWIRILNLDDPEDNGQGSALPFPPFYAASSPSVHNWDRAIEILGPAQAASTLTSYGWTLLLQGLNAETEGCLRAAQKAAVATGQITWEILASLHLSQAYYLNSQHDKGMQEFAHCMERSQQVPEATWVIVWPLLNQAYYLIRRKQLSEAERIFCLVRQRLERQDLPSYRCGLQIGLGLLALARQQFEQAYALLHETLAQRQSIYIEVYVLAEIGLARIAQHRGAYTEARERLYNMLAFSGRRSLLHLYTNSAFSLARLSLHTRQIQGISGLLEQVHQLVTAAGAADLANQCRVLQARLS
jgi:DNA-binding SARP family transcriptional activator